MQLELIDRYSRLDSSVHRLGATLKVIVAACSVIAAVSIPPHAWRLFLLHGAALLGVYALSGVPWTYLARRLALFSPMVALMAAGVPISRGMTDGWQLMVGVFCGSLLSFSTLVILVATTPVPLLLAALRRLRTPSLLIAIGALMVRYVVVLLDEVDRMRRAKAARTFTESPRWDWKILPNLVGLLFIRSVERSERVYQAMLARGWDGELRTLHDPPAPKDDDPETRKDCFNPCNTSSNCAT